MASSITVPRLGWTMEEGVFLGWLKQEGDRIKIGDPIFTLESEKAAQEVEATENGILRISPAGPAAGSTVLVGALIGYLVAEGERIDFEIPGSPLKQETAIKESPVAKHGSISSPPRMSQSNPESTRPALASASLTISPRAARTAAALDVDWRKIRGTGRTGRIRERDVLAAASDGGRHATHVQSAVAEPQMPGRMQPVSSTRRTIARRMSAGIHEAAPVTLTARADATNLLRVREQIKAVAATGASLPTLNDFFVKLVATALQRHPSLNAQWHGDRIFSPDEINIAIAIDTDDGLVAPVVYNVPAMNIHQIAAASRTLIEHARGRRLSPEQLKNGTFTVTNLGRLGIEFFTPIINLPQCAILGVGRMAPEAAWLGGRVVAPQTVPLSLTFDHRVVDGAPAARFLETLVQLIESGELPPAPSPFKGEG